MQKAVAVALGLLACAAAVALAAAPKQKTLVLLDSPQFRNTHSIFFRSLAERGHDLTFSVAGSGDDDIALSKYGDFHFDNLVLFAPSAEDLGASVTSESIVKFIDSGRNVLLAVGGNISEPIREVANDCGIDFDEAETAVIDHLNFDALDASAAGDHTVIAAQNFLKSGAILGAKPIAPVLFRGVGMAATNSPLLFRVLSGASSTYSHKPGQRVKEYPQAAGTDVLLVSAVQTRNNARVVFSGSLDLFSNKFFVSAVEAAGKTVAKSGNEVFSFELTQWLFHGRGKLRAKPFRHFEAADAGAAAAAAAADGAANPTAYRVKDVVSFAVDIEELDAVAGEWKPFAVSAADGTPAVQLEVVMIDPYIRTKLAGDAKGRFSTRVTLPDVYGVYKFVVRYSALGYSNLLLEEQVSIHPFRHDQFERFIDVAFPYYASAFTTMAAFFLFGFVFLYSNPSKPAATTTTADAGKKHQ